MVACAGIAYAADTDSGANVDNRKLQNGSFEEGQTWRESTKYKTQSQDAVPSWNTTASDGQIELFRECTDTYVKNDNGAWATLKPTAEYYAAELNANEESTLYQNVKTTPSSVPLRTSQIHLWGFVKRWQKRCRFDARIKKKHLEYASAYRGTRL